MANFNIFKHFDTYDDFSALKISISKSDDSYIDSATNLTVLGTPEILWNDICFIDSPKYIWTHGVLYDGLDTLNDETKQYIADQIDAAKISANDYELTLDDQGALICKKNSTDEGFAIDAGGSLYLC